MNRKYVVILVLGISLISSLSIWLLWFSNGDAAKPYATDFSVVDIDGDTFVLSSYSDKVIVLNFMSVWCPDCGAEIPELEHVWSVFNERIVIVSIEVNPLTTVTELQDFRDSYPNATWIWIEDTLNLLDQFNVSRIPKTLLIIRNLMIESTYVGMVDHQTLVAEIQEILG